MGKISDQRINHHVKQEMLDLIESGPTNIEGGKGIFTALASDVIGLRIHLDSSQ